MLDGFNATIMAFGQTGAGKTYTMTGSSTNYAQRGIIPRAISQLFREAEEKQDYSINIRFDREGVVIKDDQCITQYSLYSVSLVKLYMK